MTAGHDRPLDVLAHAAEPGYARVFWLAFLVGAVWLLVVLIGGLSSGGAHP